MDADKSETYEKIYKNTLDADKDCGGVISYNFLAAEPENKEAEGFERYFEQYIEGLTFLRKTNRERQAVLPNCSGLYAG